MFQVVFQSDTRFGFTRPYFAKSKIGNGGNTEGNCRSTQENRRNTRENMRKHHWKR